MSGDKPGAEEIGADEIGAVKRRTTWGPDSTADGPADEPTGAVEARSGTTVGAGTPDDTDAPALGSPCDTPTNGDGETPGATVGAGPAPGAPGRSGAATADSGKRPDATFPVAAVGGGWEPPTPGRERALRPDTKRRTGPADGAAAAAARRAARRSDTTMAMRPSAPPDGASEPGPPTGAPREPAAGVGEPATASGRPGMLLPATAPGGPADRPLEKRVPAVPGTVGRGGVNRVSAPRIVPAALTSGMRRTGICEPPILATMPPGTCVCSVGIRPTARRMLRAGRSRGIRATGAVDQPASEADEDAGALGASAMSGLFAPTGPVGPVPAATWPSLPFPRGSTSIPAPNRLSTRP